MCLDTKKTTEAN